MATAAQIIGDQIDEIAGRLQRMEQGIARRHEGERARREQAQWAKEDELQRQRADARFRADSAGAVASREALFPYFAMYGEQPPAYTPGTPAMTDLRGLYTCLQCHLSKKDGRKIHKDGTVVYSDDAGAPLVGELAELDLFSLNRDALARFERPLLHAVAAQAKKPHRSTLPPKGQFVARTVMDEGGRSAVTYFGRSSFIRELGRRAGRVLTVLARDGINRVVPGINIPMAPR
jgi:hypothetical protein